MAPIATLSIVVLLWMNRAGANCIGQCFPGEGQYEGKMVIIDNELADKDKPSSLQVLDYFAYDGKNGQKFYGNGTNWDPHGNNQTVEILQRNDEAKEYVVIDGHCIENKPWMADVACIRENAVFLTRMKVGSPAKSITAGVYASNAFWDRSLSQTDGTIHVMTETCFPIFYAMEGTDPGGTNRMVSFVVGDFKESIHSQSVFQKPKECK